MPLVLPGALNSQINDVTSQYWASCWRISLTKVANRVYRFTDHPEDIFLTNGEKFQAMDGMDGSAEQRRDRFQGANRDIRGLISDSQITDTDLRDGIFADSIIDEYLVDTRLAGVSPISVTRYFVKGVSFDGSIWNADIDGIDSQYRQPVGENWGPMCRVEVFSTGPGKCNVSTDGFFETSQIDLVLEARSQFIFTVSNSLWEENGFGNDGFCTFGSGGNTGWKSRIKFHVSDTSLGTITVHERTPYDLAVGDVIIMLPGCNKQAQGTASDVAHCRNRYDNILNFQGEPLIPGGDLARKGITIR